MKKYLLFVLLVVLTVFTFTACSSDDEPSPSSPKGIKKALVGAWETSISSSNWRTICLMPDGRLIYDYLTKEELKKYEYHEDDGLYYYYKNGHTITYDPTPDGHWAYDEADRTISMYRDDGYYSFTYKVIMGDDGKSWAGVDSDGNTDTFVKIEE